MSNNNNQRRPDSSNIASAYNNNTFDQHPVLDKQIYSINGDYGGTSNMVAVPIRQPPFMLKPNQEIITTQISVHPHPKKVELKKISIIPPWKNTVI